MKRNVFADGNGSGLVMIEGMGEYAPAAQVKKLQDEVDSLKAYQADLIRELTSCQSVLFMLSRDGEVTPAYANDAKSVLERKPEASLSARDAEVIGKLRFPTMLRKMWSGGEVQKWLQEQADQVRYQAGEVKSHAE